MRAHFVGTLENTLTSEVLAGATVTVRQQGTSTPIVETIYSVDDVVGSTTLSNPLTSDANGLVEFYLADPKRVDLFVQKSGHPDRTFTVDVFKASMTGPHVLVGSDHTASGLTTGHVLKALSGTTFGFAIDPVSDLVTTKGDWVVGSAADTLIRKAVPANGHVPIADSSTGSGWKDSTGSPSAATFLRGDGAWASPMPGDLLDFQFVRKTANEAVTSSTTPQNDDHLLQAILANEVWDFEFFIIYGTNTTSNFRFTVTAPAAAAGGFAAIPSSAAGGSPNLPELLAFAGQENIDCDGNENVVVVRGICVNGANAGNIQFQFAQATSDGTAINVRTNSYGLFRRFV